MMDANRLCSDFTANGFEVEQYGTGPEPHLKNVSELWAHLKKISILRN